MNGSTAAGLVAEEVGVSRNELGRLWMRGELSEAERVAGERYLALHADYERALNSPIGSHRASLGGDDGDQVTDEYIEWAIGAVMRWDVFKIDSRVLQMVVIEDRHVGGNLRILRLRLSALAKRFGIETAAKVMTR